VGADPGRLKIGITTTPAGGQFEAHPECVAAAQDAAKLLEGLGHDVVESHPAVIDDPEMIANFLVRWTAGVDWNLKYWSAAIGREIGADDVEPCTWALAQQGRNYSAGDLLRAFEAAQAGTRKIASWWADDGFDLLLTPTCAEPPPRLGEFEAPPDNPAAPIMRAIPFGTFTAGFNTTGQPAISLPLHVTPEGLPVGVQLVAAYGREDLLLRIAAQVEQAAPWVGRRPGVAAAA
jgi:amidase